MNFLKLKLLFLALVYVPFTQAQSAEAQVASSSHLSYGLKVVGKWSFPFLDYQRNLQNNFSLSSGLAINTTQVFQTYYFKYKEYFNQPYVGAFNELLYLRLGIKKHFQLAENDKTTFYLSINEQIGYTSMASTRTTNYYNPTYGLTANTSNVISSPVVFSLTELSGGIQTCINAKTTFFLGIGLVYTNYYIRNYEYGFEAGLTKRF